MVLELIWIDFMLGEYSGSGKMVSGIDFWKITDVIAG